MTLITISELKDQLRIEQELTHEDTLLQLYCDAVYQEVCRQLKRLLFTQEPSPKPSQPYLVLDDTNAASIKIAALMIAAHWYSHREGVSESKVHEIPLGAQHILSQIAGAWDNA